VPTPCELLRKGTSRSRVRAPQNRPLCLIRGVAPGEAYLRDLLLRVSRLADDLPEVTGLDLSPVIACPDGAIVMAARITVAPYEPRDPFLRKLR